MLILLLKTRVWSKKNQTHFINHDRLTELGNKTKFASDYLTVKNLDNYTIVSIWLSRFSELYSLFGVSEADGILTQFCSTLKNFAFECGGECYRVAFDHIVIATRVDNRLSFLKSLKSFMQKSELLDIEIAGTAYTYYFPLLYGVYFFSNSNDRQTDLSDITTHLDRQILQSTSESAADCIVLDESSKPNWAQFNALEADAKGAWNSRQFVPYYQPTFNIGTNKVVDSEILARWQHPSLGLLIPCQFIPILEREGLIFDLDLYMIEAACKKIQDWLDHGILTVPLSVNISALNIHRADFIEHLIALVTKYDVPPALLELQLPECDLVFEGNDAFVEKMNYLHEKGFSLSMDRFASSSSSALWLLQKLPLDTINVNAHFFANALCSEQSRIYVQSFLALAQKLHIKIVVTHLETIEQVKLVQSFGCTNGRGFYFSKPMSSDEFQNLIS
ncbi:MAG: EAL domain-containing protein [Oscillospiraceae bacterium]